MAEGFGEVISTLIGQNNVCVLTKYCRKHVEKQTGTISGAPVKNHWQVTLPVYSSKEILHYQ
jgi:hypothetical protein